MTIEKLQEELIRKESLIKELTTQNEHVFHQYNHLIIRNNKFLQRINDMQKVISDLHQHIHDLQAANYNLLRGKAQHNQTAPINGIVAEMRTDAAQETSPDLTAVYERWKNFPGQQARNGPNIRKQVQLLAHLYESNSLPASELFIKTGINGVTGARYVSTLKKFNLIEYKGARKKGQYHITEKGRQLINGSLIHTVSEPLHTVSEIQMLNADRANEFKSIEHTTIKAETHSNLDHIDL